jgi:hypothetical protein
MPDAVLLRLGIRLARRQAGGEKVNAVLVGHAMARGQPAQVCHAPGAEPGLLGEFQSGELFRRAALAVREAALRERPAAPADRVAVLLDEVEPAAFGGNDHGEVASLYDGVGAPRPVTALDLVSAEPDPVVGVDNAAGEGLDLWLVRVVVHRLIVPPPPDRRVTASRRKAAAPSAPASGSVTSRGNW